MTINQPGHDYKRPSASALAVVRFMRVLFLARDSLKVLKQAKQKKRRNFQGVGNCAFQIEESDGRD
jgi:hypothetical protein